MGNLLGTVSGQIKVDITQAVAAYSKMRTENAALVSAMGSASKTFDKAGNVLGVGGLAIAALLGEAVKQAADFNKEMSYFQAVSHTTQSEMDAIRKKALQLDQTTMFSVQDIAGMFVQLAKSGETTQQILGGVADASVNLAQAAQVPLTDATNDVVAAMSAFQLKTSDATMVANTFAGAANSSILNLSDLANSLKYVGGTAQALGVGFKESTVALDLLGQAGIKGSMGGTELRQIMVSLLGTTKAGSTELTKLGIITKNGTNLFFDQSGKVKSLADVFQTLQDHTKGMTNEQKLAAEKIIFNNRALSAASILTRDGAKGFADMNAQISKTVAADVAAKRMDNLAGDTKKLTSSLKTMAIQAGQPLQNFLRGIVQSLTAVVHWFESLSPATQSNIIHFLAIAAALLLFLSAIAKTVAFGLKMVETFKHLSEAFTLVKGILGGLVGGVKALTSAMLANPIVLIIAAVIALGIAFYELYQHSKTFRDIIDAIGRAFRTAFEATVNWFKGLPAFFEHVWKDITGAFGAAINWIKQNWDILASIILLPILGPFTALIFIIHRFGKQIGDFFAAIPGAIGDAFTSAWKFVEDFFTNLPYKIGYAIGLVFGYLLRFEKDAYVWVFNFDREIIETLIGFFEKLPGEVWRNLQHIGTDMNNWKNDAVNIALQAGSQFFDAVGRFFERLPGMILNFLNKIRNDVAGWRDDVVRDAEQTGTRVYNAIVNWFEKLPGEARKWFDSVVNSLKTSGDNAYNTAVQYGSNIITGVESFLDNLPNAVSHIFDEVINVLENAVSDAFNAAMNFAGGLWDGFKHGLGISSPSYIEKAMYKITDTMDSETRKINGYVKNIQGLGAQVAQSNPLLALGGVGSGQYGSVSPAQLNQLAVLQSILRGTQGYQLSQSASSAAGSGVIEGQPTKVLEVNVYNPAAETTTASATQQLRTLASMGAF